MFAAGETTFDDGWGSFAAKKDKKKKGNFEDTQATEDADITQNQDPEPIDDFAWGKPAKSSKKGGKKGLISEVQEDPIIAVEPIAAAGVSGGVNDWMDWGTTDKKGKKGKKGNSLVGTMSDEPVPPPPPPTAPEPSAFDDSWGATTTTKPKKSKKGKTADPEPPVVTIPDPPGPTFDTFEDELSGWGLSSKDKKKKEREREKDKKEAEEKEKAEEEEREKLEKEEKEKAEKEKEKVEKEKSKDKGKLGKKGKAAAATESSKIKDLMADSVPDPAPAFAEETSWGIWGGSAKKDNKKKSGKNAIPDIPPPVPTPPAQGLTPEPEFIPGVDEAGEDEWASFTPAKAKGKKDAKTTSKASKADDVKAAKKSDKAKAEDELADLLKDDMEQPLAPMEESAAKAAKSFWGGMGTTSTTKSKGGKEKDKDKDTGKAKDLMSLDDLPNDDITGTVEERAPTSNKKGSKSKADGKSKKETSKNGASKEKSDDALLDDLLELGDEELAGVLDETDGKKAEPWAFWGGGKKTGGKKADELEKEITKPNGTNQKGSLKNNFKKENEPEDTPTDEAWPSQPLKSSKSTMSAAKTSAKSTVLQRVKDLEKEKEGGKAKSKNSEATAEPQGPPPAPEIIPLPKSESAFPKKSASKLKAGSKKKPPTPPPVEDKGLSAVPGSFPGEILDDDLLDLLDEPPFAKKSSKKSAKAKTEPKQEPIIDVMDDFNWDAPAPEAPPTPPEEPEPTPAKPAKKERARVVKNEGASSWGFWGAAPKKESKKDNPSKDDTDVSPPKPKEKKAAPGLSRSKSTKTAKEKDKEVEKSSKSSGSDEKEKKSESRPSKSRGSSFGGLFGGPPPVRANKPVRRNSTAPSKTASSRRQSISMDVDATGLPSPPLEYAPEMSSKAAKIMGTAKLDRKASTRGKQKAKGNLLNENFRDHANIMQAVPDPYAIDDDDMVMVGGLDNPMMDDPIPQDPIPKAKKDKPSSSKPKKETKPAADFVDDVVMVEAGSPQDGPDEGARETLAFDERPRPQRSNTSARKPKGSMMGGLFGFGKTRRASDTLERPRSKGVITDDEGLSRRKRTVTGGDDSAKRLRRDDRKVRRTDREDRAAEGFVYDAPADGGAATEAEDAEARRERKAKRAAAREVETQDAEDRRARRRETERASEDARKLKAKEARDRRARRDEEAEAIRLEEKQARRAARAEMNAKIAASGTASRPAKTDRRRSHMDPPMASGANDDIDRHARREARRAARTPGEKSSRKKTTAAPVVDDYFDPRNGATGQDPYMHGANDHTSSWVKSQISDPAPPPPVEGTVIEPTPVLGGADDAALDDDAARRAKRKSRRQSRYVDVKPEEEEARRRRRDREIRSSEGSKEDDGGRPYASRRKSDYVGGMRGFDARPSLAAGGKRGSWLKRVSGF